MMFWGIVLCGYGGPAVFADNRALRLIGWMALPTGIAALIVGWREARAQRGL